MGKGGCKKTNVKKTNDERPIQQTKIEEPSSSSISSDDKNSTLMEYINKILNNPHNNSYTKRHVSIELGIKEKSVRTSDNVGLEHCIVINVNKVDAKFPYALSPDCYCVFCDFFGPLIDDYHGPPQNEALLEAQYGNVDNYINIDLNFNERARIVYCDMIVRRNIEDIPFTAKMSSKNRKEVINIMEPKFRSICKDNIELENIPDEWEERLNGIIDELNEVGSTMEDYPKDRLNIVFKTPNNIYQGLLLNHEDHFQIVTSTNDGRLGIIYSMMYDIYNHPKLDKVEYIAHPFLGFLTLNPAYVGISTTIRVIVKFPFLSLINDINETILREHDVIVEPEDKQCPTNGMLVIYNKMTLNKTEEDILIDVIEGFNLLYDLEDDLENNTPMAVKNDTMPVESIEKLFNLIAQSDSKSYTKKYLTNQIISQYCNNSNKTKFNNLFNHCIRGNAYYHDSLFPRAVDGDCYIKFREFFIPILYETNCTKSAAHPYKPNYGTASDSIQYMMYHRDIRSYRVRFCRNIENYPYPATMSNNDRENIERIMIIIFNEFPVEIEGDYLPLDNINQSIYFEELNKWKLIPTISNIDKTNGCYRRWPKNRGLFIAKADPKNPALLLVVQINITDHIKVICLDKSGTNLASCYDRAVKVMRLLDLKFDQRWSRKPGFGFFTYLPQSVGCGLRISAKIMLKNLGNNREIMEYKCKLYQFVYRGSNGAGSPAIKNEFDISLKLNLNVTEQYILLLFCQRLKELILNEREFDHRVPRPINSAFIPDSDTDNILESILTGSDDFLNDAAETSTDYDYERTFKNSRTKSTRHNSKVIMIADATTITEPKFTNED